MKSFRSGKTEIWGTGFSVFALDPPFWCQVFFCSSGVTRHASPKVEDGVAAKWRRKIIDFAALDR